MGTDRLAPSGAPVWNTPSIDAERGLLYVGNGENYSSPANAFSDAIVALRLDTGAIAWHRQMTAGDAWNMGCETAARINCPPEDGPDFDFGAATIIARDGEGRDVLLAGQKSGHVYALDLSRRGAARWRRKLGRGGIQGGVHFGTEAPSPAAFNYHAIVNGQSCQATPAVCSRSGRPDHPKTTHLDQCARKALRLSRVNLDLGRAAALKVRRLATRDGA